MEITSAIKLDDEKMDLPPGFRFHPTDEELITQYLSPKVLDNSFSPRAVGEVDLNKIEPWDLPWKAKMGEKEWYFFYVRDRKYPTGSRTNRATHAGYWKATGKDKEIFKVKTLVGMKKTLVFYKGRAPKGEKTNWVMHEYRLEGKNYIHSVSRATKSEWVMSRIFKKCSGGKKVHISGLIRTNSDGDDSGPSNLPPLLDVSSDDGHQTSKVVAEASRVTCFSNFIDDQKPQHIKVDNLASSSSRTSGFSQVPLIFPKVPNQNSILSDSVVPFIKNFHYSNSIFMQDHSMLRLLLEQNGSSNTRQNAKSDSSKDNGLSTDMSFPLSDHEIEMSPFADQEFPSTSTGPVDLDCLWNY